MFKADCLVDNAKMLEIHELNPREFAHNEKEEPNNSDQLKESSFSSPADDADWVSDNSADEVPKPEIGKKVIQDDPGEISESSDFDLNDLPEEVRECLPGEVSKRELTERMLNYSDYLTDCQSIDDLDIDLEEIIRIREQMEQEQDEWYSSYKSKEFVQASGLIEELWRQPDTDWSDWVLLEDSEEVDKRYGNKVDIPVEPRKTRNELSDSEREAHDTISGYIAEIRTSQDARQAVRSLYEFHKANPKVKLRPYFVDMSYFLVRYVVWGLNFYAAKDEEKDGSMKDSDVIWEGYTTSDMKPTWGTSLFYHPEENTIFERVTFFVISAFYRAWLRFKNWIIPHD